MARKELDSATKRAAKQGLLIVIAAVFTLEATAVLQYFYSQHILSEEATRRAEGQLAATELHISNVVDQVETAVRNSVWSVEQQMYRPDSLAAITVRLVESNPVICGSTVAMVDKNLAPYSYQQDGKVLTSSLATEAYDYKHQEWFVKPLELQGGYWSEPYYDEGGGNMLMTTYSIPVTDKRGRVAAVFTADVSLDWLTELVGLQHGGEPLRPNHGVPGGDAGHAPHGAGHGCQHHGYGHVQQHQPLHALRGGGQHPLQV